MVSNVFLTLIGTSTKFFLSIQSFRVFLSAAATLPISPIFVSFSVPSFSICSIHLLGGLALFGMLSLSASVIFLSIDVSSSHHFSCFVAVKLVIGFGPFDSFLLLIRLFCGFHLSLRSVCLLYSKCVWFFLFGWLSVFIFPSLVVMLPRYSLATIFPLSLAFESFLVQYGDLHMVFPF